MVRRRAVLAAAVVSLPLALLGQTSWAHATPASTVGWWSQASLPTVGAAEAPLVPAGGLFIESAPTGPLALSAVAVDLPDSASLASVMLKVSGQSRLSAAPTLCLLTSPITSTQGGAWSDRPAYDCAVTTTGTLGADGRTVSFDLLPFVRNGRAGAVILATGPSDRAAFEPPAIAVATAAGGVQPSKPPAASGSAGTPTQDVATAPPQQQAPVTGEFPPLAASIPAAAPTVTRPQEAPQLAAVPPQLPRNAAVTTESGNSRRTVGTGVGVSLLVLILVYWADGFGAVPVRSWVMRATSRRSEPQLS